MHPFGQIMQRWCVSYPTAPYQLLRHLYTFILKGHDKQVNDRLINATLLCMFTTQHGLISLCLSAAVSDIYVNDDMTSFRFVCSRREKEEMGMVLPHDLGNLSPRPLGLPPPPLHLSP